MSSWSVLVLLASVSTGSPHPLDTAAQALQQRALFDARDVVNGMARATPGQEPAFQVLLGAVDRLYRHLQIDGALVVLDLARVSGPLSAPDRARVAVRHGILLMELDDGVGARKAFQEALAADRGVSIPGYMTPRTRGVFDEVMKTIPVPPARPTAPAPGDGSRFWGMVAGGTGLALVGGGMAAGAIALSSYQAEERATLEGDELAHARNREAAKTARDIANGLYGLGAVALGVGAYLFLSAPAEVSVGAGVGPGHTSLVVGGRF